MMKMIVMTAIITSLTLSDEVALVDWAGVSSRLGSLALACGQTCQSPGPRRGCSCEPGCRELGNCCLDFYTGPELDKNLNMTRKHVSSSRSHVSSSRGHVTCQEVRVSGLLASQHVLMVTSCPRDYVGPQSVVTQCSRSSYSYSYLLDLPVTSAASGRVFANLYCAQCHEDASDLLPQVRLRPLIGSILFILSSDWDWSIHFILAPNWSILLTLSSD